MTLQDLITAGTLRPDLKVVGTPVFSEDGCLVLDQAELFKATPFGIERVVSFACEGHEDDDCHAPSDFGRCYTSEADAIAAMPEVRRLRDEADERIREARRRRIAGLTGGTP